MPILSLYNFCLRKVSLYLIIGIWQSRQENPFRFLHSTVLHDLFTTTLLLQKLYRFRAADLEILLTSGRLREFKIHSMNLRQELGQALKSLTMACQNLEVLTLTNLSGCKPDPSEALQELFKNSPNLKHIHCEVEFNLKALRSCKKLRTVMLHFNPKQPWYDFLDDERGCLQPMDSLELFTICGTYNYDFQSISSDYIITLLRHCPELTSLGMINTSRTFAQLHRASNLPQVKLRCCCWGKSKYPDREREWIRMAVICHPVVEDLYITVYCAQNIVNLSSLRNLVLLDIHIDIKSDLSVPLYNALKDIGLRLKYLSLELEYPMDISIMLQNCPNLEALRLRTPKYTEFALPSVSLPNLKYLTINDSDYKEERRPLSLVSNCNNMTELFTKGFDDVTLDKFLRKNSLTNLKIASLCVVV